MPEVNPTRQNLAIYREKLDGAKKGFVMLKQKTDALHIKYLKLISDIRKLKSFEIIESSSQSLYHLALADYAAGNYRSLLLDAPKLLASTRVRTTTTVNFSGLRLPLFELISTGAICGQMFLGLAGGGLEIKCCMVHWQQYLAYLIKLASLRISVVLVHCSLKAFSKRMNYIEFVVIPSYTSTISRIENELDEIEREEFSRIKITLDRKLKREIERELQQLKTFNRQDSQDEQVDDTFGALYDADLVFYSS